MSIDIYKLLRIRLLVTRGYIKIVEAQWLHACLVSSSPDRASGSSVRIERPDRALAGDIVLCSWKTPHSHSVSLQPERKMWVSKPEDKVLSSFIYPAFPT